MMKDMKHDDFLEKKADAYVEGTEEPKIDLSAAKRALGEEQGKRRSAKKRFWVALASACACLLLTAIVLVGVLPSFASGPDQNADRLPSSPSAGENEGNSDAPQDPASPSDPQGGGSSGETPQVIRYELESAENRAAGVNELVSDYGKSVKKLTDLGLSANVHADYTLYYVEERAVLLRTEALYTQNGARVSVVIYTDLSSGRYRAAELEDYGALPSRTSAYAYEMTFLNGEYLCRGNFSGGGYECCVQLESSYQPAFFSFMDYLT